MKQIVIISGKGGTGKTVLTAAFAALSKNAVFADCDVDAADLHLLLKPVMLQRNEFRSGRTAKINKTACNRCGKCISVCRFAAISRDFTVDAISCEGCGVCAHICPASAVTMEENHSGEWFISRTPYGPMVHAKLGIAEENSGKLVTVVREAAKKIAVDQHRDYVIIDGPPGIGCPVIASLANVDMALIVVEPTLSGMHDMLRVAGVARHFSIEAKIIINKSDINIDNVRELKKICGANDIEILAELPFSEDVSKALVKGMPVVEYCKGGITGEIAALWEKIQSIIRNKS